MYYDKKTLVQFSLKIGQRGARNGGVERVGRRGDERAERNAAACVRARRGDHSYLFHLGGRG